MRDVFNPIHYQEAAGCSLPELVWFERVLQQGMVDCYRLLHPNQRAFTWWSYLGQARMRNLGWRIDHVLASAELAPQLVRTEILSKAYHSDHAPVLAEFHGLSNLNC